MPRRESHHPHLKLAGAAPGQVGSPQADDAIMAKAFMDQAYTQVASRCGRLMDDAYRLGFEIVKKNEATSKVLGVFAFRVAKELYYVPVFFLNGIIRGADLLHRFTPKRFVANTPDWADYLINQATTEQGRSVPRSEVSRIQDNVRMDRIVWPPIAPGSFKRASVSDKFVPLEGSPTTSVNWVLNPQEMEKFASDWIPEDAATNWESWIDDLCVQDRAVPLHLPEYMAKSAAAFNGLIAEIEKSPQLADLLMRNYTQEQI